MLLGVHVTKGENRGGMEDQWEFVEVRSPYLVCIRLIGTAKVTRLDALRKFHDILLHACKE